MKKIIIAILVVAVVVLALPFVGNKTVQNVLDTKITELKSHGIGVKESQDNSSYLTTKKHYEFVLEDSEAFMEYLNQYSTQQIPPYVNSVVDGIVVGADIEYSNIPYFSTVKLDIYPVDVSSKLDELKSSDKALYDTLVKFIQDRGLVYHMEHHISSKKFEGYVKDIDQTFHSKEGGDFHLLISDAKFHGQGELVAPEKSDVTIRKIALNMQQQDQKVLVSLENMHTTSNFASLGTYATTFNLDNAKFVVSGSYNDDLYFNMEKLNSTFSSDAQSAKAEAFSKVDLQKFEFKSNRDQMAIENLTSDMAITKLDAPSYIKVIELANKLNNGGDFQTQQELQVALIDLFAKGFEFKVGNLSFEDIQVDGYDYKGMKFKGDLVVKEDSDLATKLQQSPLAAAQNIDFNGRLELSKDMYEAMDETAPVQQYVKMEQDKAIFDIVIKDAQLTVNGKVVR